MKKTRRSLVLVAALLGIAAIPATALASTPARPGAYMSVFLGATSPEDSTLNTTQFEPVSYRTSRIEYDTGINVGGTGGFDFGFFRLEGEMSYKRGPITSITDESNRVRYVNTDGHVGAFAMLMNGFFDLHNTSPVTPYFGGGIGIANLMVSKTRGVEANTGAINYRVLQDDDKNTFAYQVGGGLEVELNRRLSVDMGYRYFGTSKVTYKKDWPNSTELRFNSHNAAVGLRVKF